MMTRVTALGCSLSAVVAACCAVRADVLAATTHALAIFGLSGEIAAEGAPGPGTLRVRLMDALYRIDGRTLELGARIGRVKGGG
jgi:hydroxyethylthiazole kinase